MAEIDKALPNVDETIEVVQDEMVQQMSEPENVRSNWKRRRISRY